jgi:lysophospholipase L1-like esterase
MKNRLPKLFLLAIISGVIIVFILGVKCLPEFIEKQSLKPPPPYKKLSAERSKLSTQSGKIKYPHDYTFVILGDSMTETLGNTDELRGYLNQYYPNKTFEVLNYGYGATSIVSAKQRLTENTTHADRNFDPILNIDFDYLIVESFGHNPLSEFNEEGLKKQTEILDDLVELIATTSGKEKLIFLGTIGTNKQTYAKTTEPQLDSKTREQWALERDSYIKNHIDYAKSKGIPVIDAFTPSLDSSGNTKQYLIRTDDYLHPSPSGALFIQKKIADFLAQNNLIN